MSEKMWVGLLLLLLLALTTYTCNAVQTRQGKAVSLTLSSARFRDAFTSYRAWQRNARQRTAPCVVKINICIKMADDMDTCAVIAAGA